MIFDQEFWDPLKSAKIELQLDQFQMFLMLQRLKIINSVSTTLLLAGLTPGDLTSTLKPHRASSTDSWVQKKA